MFLWMDVPVAATLDAPIDLDEQLHDDVVVATWSAADTRKRKLRRWIVRQGRRNAEKRMAYGVLHGSQQVLKEVKHALHGDGVAYM